MKKVLLSASFLVFGFQFSFSQNPLLKEWDYRFGGNSTDVLTCFQQTSDGGYIFAGYSYSGISGNKTQANWGDRDYWIVKTDSLGNMEWDKDFGGTDYDVLYSLQQTADGGYILGGYSESGISGNKTQDTWGGRDYWIVKTDSLGNIEWDKDFGGTDFDLLYSIQQTADGGFILGGYSESGISGNKTQDTWGWWDYWIVKTNSLGNIEWDKDFGGTGGDYFQALRQTDDGGYILGGRSYSGINGNKTQVNWGLADYWIVKTDSLGNMEWDKDFGGTGEDWLYSLQQTADGGFILGGRSESPMSGNKTQDTWGWWDYWIVKTDSLGNMEWDKDFGGTDAEDEFGNVSQTSDGGYLVAGTSYSPISGDKTEDNLGIEQTWIVKTDSLGNKQWDKTLFTTGHDEIGFAIQTDDGCYAFANYTDGEIGGYKTQPNWDTVCNPYCTQDYWIVKFCDSTLNIPAFSSNNTAVCEKSCIDFTEQSLGNPFSWQWHFEGGSPDTSSLPNPQSICYDTAGVYDVTLITCNQNGCDTLTLNDFITVYPTPPTPVITQNGNVLTSTPATTYQWVYNSSAIPGATNQSISITQNGQYTVIITDENGCENYGVLDVIIGVENVFSNVSFYIFPNPTTSTFTLTLEGIKQPEVKIEITNTLGQLVSATTIANTRGKISKEISLAAKGTYFVTVSAEDFYVVKKVVVE